MFFLMDFDSNRDGYKSEYLQKRFEYMLLKLNGYLNC